MSFTVKFFNFSKRFNSTKVPALDAGTEYNCIIKNGSSIINPKIELDIGLTSNPSSYNYAYIPAFGRYYYIREWEFNSALWVAHMNVDVLSTYRTNIGNANLYVIRSSNDNDGSIMDTLYPTKTGCTFARDTLSDPWVLSVNNGVYVVGVATDDANFGSLVYYIFDTLAMRAFTSRLYDKTVTVENGFNFDNISQSLQLAIVNPTQYIKSAVYLPIKYSDIPPSLYRTMSVFNWDFGSVAQVVDDPKYTTYHDFSIPKHPQTNTRGNYVNAPPFTRAQLKYPPFGVIDIDTNITATATTLRAYINVDLPSGTGNIEIRSNNFILNKINGLVGVPIQVSQVNRDLLGSAVGVASTIGSAMSGNFIGELTGVGNAINSFMPRINSVGSNGSFAQIFESARLEYQFFSIVSDDNAQNGRPLCAKRVVKNLGGYMLIQDGDVAINGTLEESQQIQSLLEGGFYYE